MLVAALVTENTGCVTGPDKFHVAALPVSSTGVPGKLITRLLTTLLPTVLPLLNVANAPVTVPLGVLIEPAVSVTEPDPALIVAGVNALTSVKLMPVPPAVTAP